MTRRAAGRGVAVAAKGFRGDGLLPLACSPWLSDVQGFPVVGASAVMQRRGSFDLWGSISMTRRVDHFSRRASTSGG